MRIITYYYSTFLFRMQEVISKIAKIFSEISIFSDYTNLAR